MQLHSSIVLISTALTQEVEGVKGGGVTGHKGVYNRGVLNRFFKSLNVMSEGRHKSHHFLVRPLNDVTPTTPLLLPGSASVFSIWVEFVYYAFCTFTRSS